MTHASRRDFIRRGAALAAGAAGLSFLPPAIRKALAIGARNETKSIRDVEHVVILMQENRSFDHYFGTLRGVRGFGDRFPVPLPSGKSIWYESDGAREILPFRLDQKRMNAALVPGTPHNFPDAQAAWNQGSYGFWPRFKTEHSMGYYTREELPFQFALAEAFTLCDAHHCSVTSGTDPNRIVFFSGANFDPQKRAAGVNCTEADSEPVNLRCWPKGLMPDPGYTYKGSAFSWPTIPEVLEKAGVSWRIYQDPNDNFSGAMHGGLAFQGFRTAARESSLYRNGLTHWSLADFARDVKNETLPAVSWILPTMRESEHPDVPSSPARGGYFTQQVLEALTANPRVFSGTFFILTFDENDGLFDHVPPPAVPSCDRDGARAGASTLELSGMYFVDDAGHSHLDPRDTVSGNVRPWGLGARVPMTIVSPWSRGGWVCSQVFDHTSVGQFLERRFGVTIPAITPWHRSICGDLTSAFDFVAPNRARFPKLPDMGGYEAIEEASKKLPAVHAPSAAVAGAALPRQEKGVRASRALPYALEVSARPGPGGRMTLGLVNSGRQGAVLHVYDKLHLDRIPRRYTVEAGRSLDDAFWNARAEDGGKYDLWVCGPNGFVRTFRGSHPALADAALPEIRVLFEPARGSVLLEARNEGSRATVLEITSNAYRTDGPWKLELPAGGSAAKRWSLAASRSWYDFTARAADFERRFAGRLETGRHGVSDPAFGDPAIG
jgi:phospholipase C